MILSHRYRFIFIKTMKTAGTSIEMALSRHCGPDDVITPISPEDEAARRRAGVSPRNYEREPSESHSGPVRPGPGENVRFYNHMSAAEIRESVGDEVWDSYFKFCVERNPWERVLSMYHWKHRNADEPGDVSEFLRSRWVRLLHRRGWGLYTIDDEVVVDAILRYEDLEEELDSVRRRVGIQSRIDLPHAKGQYRRDRRPPAAVMTPDDIDYVSEIFAKEIALLGYDPDL